jgi:predicted ATPase
LLESQAEKRYLGCCLEVACESLRPDLGGEQVYITRVYLRDIRAFKRLEIEFDKPGSSALIVGDNGDGKSTLLRCIAMGLCDESSAAALHRELPGDFVRHGRKKGRIEIWLAASAQVSYRIVTTIKSLETFERVQQRVFKVSKAGKKTPLKQDSFPWKNIFASAYGAGIRTIGTGDFKSYQAVDAVYPLFVYSVPLQNPELVVRRLIEAAREARSGSPREKQVAAETQLSQIKNLLATMLNLNSPDQVILTSTGIEIKGLEDRTELGALGDGYRATITWLVDLLSWWFLYKGTTSARIMPFGIILVDEVEQHLHPRWQIRIMRLLCKVFPKLQIIATTHSPLVISGSKDLPIHRLDRGDHRVLNASGWRAEDVYRDVMGLASSRPPPDLELVEEYRRLRVLNLEGKASASDRATLRRLRRNLERDLSPTDPVLVTAELEALGQFVKNG